MMLNRLDALLSSHAVGNPPARSAEAGRLSRRRLLGTSIGLALGSTALRSGLEHSPANAAAPPLPIPGGLTFGSPQVFHVHAPGFEPIDAEPITITDFDGVVGLAYISGTCTRTNLATNETTSLWFVSNDMRFMQGKYRAANGTVHKGTFAFI